MSAPPTQHPTGEQEKPATAQQRLQAHALGIAHIGVVGMALSMPLSRAAFNISALLMVTGWLLSGQWQQKWDAIGHNASVWASTGLFAVSALSLFWSGPLTADHAGQLKEYSRLLYVPLIISLLQHHRLWWQRAWVALLTGMLITLAAYLLDIWLELPGTRTYGTHTAGQGVFYHHIAQGMVLSFIGAYALHRALSRAQPTGLRLCWLTVALSTLAGLLAVGESRTAQLSVLAAYALVVLTHLPGRLRGWGLVLLVVVAGGLATGTEHVHNRFAIALQEMASFKQDGEHTSVGARLQAWQFSSQLIGQTPWWGHGVGSYRALAHAHFAQSPICGLGVCEQPHNQFILTTVETGLLGLLMLLVFFLTPALRRLRCHSETSLTALVWPFMAIVMVTACFDSSLKIQGQAFFTLVTMALLMSSHAQAQRQPDIDSADTKNV